MSPKLHNSREFTVELPSFRHWRNQVKCQMGCPVFTDAGGYVQAIADGDYRSAFLIASAPNPFPSVCGRVCAAPCEDECRRGAIDSPISIRALKRSATDRFGVESPRPETREELFEAVHAIGNATPWHLPVTRQFHSGVTSDLKVAIAGGGPAGLACAYDLAQQGFNVTIFEATDQLGGMMVHGIPEYRLSRRVIEKEIRHILDAGIEVKYNTPLSGDFTVSDLKSSGFDAIFLATGAQKGRDLSLEGSDLDGVVKALDYLLNINQGYRMDLGGQIVVIGGGFVAFDAARLAARTTKAFEEEVPSSGDAIRTALDAARLATRQGIAEVTMVSLESFEEMPVMQSTQGMEEFQEARREGITFLPRWAPKRFLGDNNHLTGVELQEVARVFDEEGRFNPEYHPNVTQTIDASAVVLAIGQQPNLSFLRDENSVEVTSRNTVDVEPETLRTSEPGVYAGGDVAFGPRNLIEAIANGKTAASTIAADLAGEATQKDAAYRIEIQQLSTREYTMPEGYEICDREAPPTLELDRRTGIAEVEETYTDEAAQEQAARCLQCHTAPVYNPDLCILCYRCVDVCPESCLAFAPRENIQLPDNQKIPSQAGDLLAGNIAFLKDEEACIRCGLCAIRCPTDAITMEQFGYTVETSPVNSAIQGYSQNE